MRGHRIDVHGDQPSRAPGNGTQTDLTRAAAQFQDIAVQQVGQQVSRPP